MINATEENFLRRHAYIPEHLPAYGRAFSGGEPFLLENYLCYLRGDTLVFIGYPLGETYGGKKMNSLLEDAVKKFGPSRIALLAASFTEEKGERRSPDSFYRLSLASLRVPPKVENMIRRAGRELTVARHRDFTAGHQRLIEGFLASREVEEEIPAIFGRIGAYLSADPDAWIFDARDSGGRLAGFDVAGFGARDYAFYLFNFRSPDFAVPGTSDLLLHALVGEARSRGQAHINLGLGIGPGVVFFKEKWGAAPFLRHEIILFSPSRPSLLKSIWEGMFSS